MVPWFQGSKVISKVSGHGLQKSWNFIVFDVKLMMKQGFEDVLKYHCVGGRWIYEFYRASEWILMIYHEFTIFQLNTRYFINFLEQMMEPEHEFWWFTIFQLNTRYFINFLEQMMEPKHEFYRASEWIIHESRSINRFSSTSGLLWQHYFINHSIIINSWIYTQFLHSFLIKLMCFSYKL